MHHVAGEGDVLAALPHSRRVLCMAQASDHMMLTGAEDGSVKVRSPLPLPLRSPWCTFPAAPPWSGDAC